MDFNVYIYMQPIFIIIIGMLILSGLIICIYLKLQSKKKLRFLWKILCLLALLVSIWIIWYCTLGNRTETIERKIQYIPFISILLARQQPEYYRTMFMNILLFYPFGIFSSFSVRGTWRKKSTIVMITSCILSLILESVQYYTRLGIFEVDDVIMNTLGGILGCQIANCAYYIKDRVALFVGRDKVYGQRKD